MQSFLRIFSSLFPSLNWSDRGLKSYNIFIVDKEHEGLKLGKYLRDKLMMSRNGLVKVKQSDSLKVNGCYVHTDKILKAGDKVEFNFPDQDSENILPEYMDLDIVYEDDYMIVVNKKSGILIHPARNHYMGTLANGIMYHLMEEGRNITIRPVNRLDRNTSGLVLFAKSSHVQHLISLDGFKDKIVKEYLAIAQGIVEPDSGTIDAPIAIERVNWIKRMVREDGNRSITHFQVIERYMDYTLLNIILETGRTHQIRVHMAHLGHPLLGDDLYGGSQEKIERQALHAHNIKMLHPITHSNLKLTAEIPEDMLKLIRKHSED